MAHICAKNLRTYTLSRHTARAAGNKVQVSYIEIIGMEFVTIWARLLTHPAEINATRVRFPSGDLGLINWVSYAFVSKSKCFKFDYRSFASYVSKCRHVIFRFRTELFSAKLDLKNIPIVLSLCFLTFRSRTTLPVFLLSEWIREMLLIRSICGAPMVSLTAALRDT